MLPHKTDFDKGRWDSWPSVILGSEALGGFSAGDRCHLATQVLSWASSLRTCGWADWQRPPWSEQSATSLARAVCWGERWDLFAGLPAGARWCYHKMWYVILLEQDLESSTNCECWICRWLFPVVALAACPLHPLQPVLSRWRHLLITPVRFFGVPVGILVTLVLCPLCLPTNINTLVI